MNTTNLAQGFTIIRYVEATPAQAWDAWTEPEAIAEWWHLPNTTTPREGLEYNVHVGGYYIYTSIDEASGERTVSGGIFQDVTPHERLVFTWGAPGFDPEDLPIVTVTLEETGDGTYVSFEIEGVSGELGDESFYDTWDQALTRLKEHLA